MEKSSFFNSVNGDRKYQASDFASYFNSLLTNGVFSNPSTNLQVIVNNNMTVTIRSGKAWINGYCYINDSDLILPITVADGVLKRIDRVVIQYSTINREIKVKVKKGTFASSPVAPTLQRDADIYELGIADILINNGSISITQANITDLRMNTSLCGWVNSLIQADTTAIFNQYIDWFNTKTGQYNTEMAAKEIDFTTQFNTWFDGVKNILGSDIAGSLLNQINGLAGAGRTTQTVKGNADAIAALSNSVATSLADMSSQVALKSTKTEVNEVTTILTPTGTANVIILPITLVDKKKYSFKATANSTGAVTINSITFKKLDGTVIGNGGVKANKVYNFYYDSGASSVFILASAEGNVTADKVLAGYTFSNDDDTGLIGTYNKTLGVGDKVPYTSTNLTVPPTINMQNMGLPSTIGAFVGITPLDKVLWVSNGGGVITAFPRTFGAAVYSVTLPFGSNPIRMFVNGNYTYYCTQPNGSGTGGVYQCNSETGAVIWKSEVVQSGTAARFTTMSPPNINNYVAALFEFYDGSSVVYYARLFNSAGTMVANIYLGSSGDYYTSVGVDDENKLWIMYKNKTVSRYNAAYTAVEFTTAALTVNNGATLVFVDGFMFIPKSDQISLYKITKTGAVTYYTFALGTLNAPPKPAANNTMIIIGSNSSNTMTYINSSGAIVKSVVLPDVIGMVGEYPNGDIFMETYNTSTYYTFRNIAIQITITA